MTYKERAKLRQGTKSGAKETNDQKIGYFAMRFAQVNSCCRISSLKTPVNCALHKTQAFLISVQGLILLLNRCAFDLQ
jgi:hypothetical protein